MREHWAEATNLIDVLVMKATGQDKDGMDLFFTCGPVEIKNKKKEKDFVEAMKDPEAQPRDNIYTDMKRKLGDILRDYQAELEKERRTNIKVKNLTIIVLTDGIWGGMDDKDDVFQKIVTLIVNLKISGREMKDRPLSIEFIQFGEDPDATLRLRHLDDDLKKLKPPLP
jgi:hypothetical protein